MKNKRRTNMIDAKFQTSFIARFTAIVLLSSLAIGLLIFYLTMGSTTVAIENTRVVVKRTSDFILPIIVLTLVMVTIASSAVLFLAGLSASHKIAGPLYRFRKGLEEMGTGDLTVNFSTRDKDQLKDLAKSLGSMCTSFKSRHADLKGKCEDLKGFLKDRDYTIGKDEGQELSRRLEEIKEVLTFFKV